MRQVVEIRVEWLMEVAPHNFSTADIKELQGKKGLSKNVGTAGERAQ